MTAPEPAAAATLALALHGPWLLLTDEVGAGAMVEAVRRLDGYARRLRGSLMRSDEELHREFAGRLSFPDYYGHNWDALLDCLTDLAWRPAPAYLLVIEDADQVLAEAPRKRLGLLGDLLAEAAAAWAEPVAKGQWWDRPAIPFHVVLLPPGDDRHGGDRHGDDRDGDDPVDVVRRRWAAAGVRLTQV
jgi:RNAse (barnase) inhibitor barstar